MNICSTCSAYTIRILAIYTVLDSPRGNEGSGHDSTLLEVSHPSSPSRLARPTESLQSCCGDLAEFDVVLRLSRLRSAHTSAVVIAQRLVATEQDQAVGRSAPLRTQRLDVTGLCETRCSLGRHGLSGACVAEDGRGYVDCHARGATEITLTGLAHGECRDFLPGEIPARN